MNVNKIIGKFLFVILCSFIILPKISAFNICDDKNCKSGYTETEEGKSLKYHENTSSYPNYLFYCTQPNQPWPKDCVYSTTFSQRFSAAVSYIIAKERNTDSMTYNGAQRTISKFLFNNWENGHGNNLRQDWSLNDSQKAVYNKAKKIFDNNTKIKFEQTSLSFNTSNKATVKYKEIETPFDIYCSVTDGATVSINRETRVITVNSKGLDLSKSISLTCRTKFGYKPIHYYKCTGQELVRKANEKDTEYRYGPKTTINSTPPKYTITYNTNGGTWSEGKPEDKTIKYNDQYTITSKKPTKEGYDFIGWRVKRSDNRWYYNFDMAGSGYTCEESKCTYGWYINSYNKDNSKKHKGKLLFTSGTKITLKDKWVYLNDLNDDNKKKRRVSYTYTFYAQWKKKPSEKVDLTINKVYKKSDDSYASVISPATFALYSDSGCNNVEKDDIVTSAGTVTIEVNKGTYYLKETKAPEGYTIDNTCRKVVVGEDGTEIDIENATSCSSLLTEINLNYSGEERKKQLINLYLEQLNLGHDYRKLLEFDPEKTACDIKNCSNDVSVSCLAASKPDNINENDLSCYEKTVNSDGAVGFCQTSLSINNNLNISTKNHTFTGISGQFLIKQEGGKLHYFNGNNEIIVEAANPLNGNIKKTCYLTNSKDYSSNDIDIVVAFGNNTGGTIPEVLPSNIIEATKITEDKGHFKKITFEKRLSYDLNEVYLERISGRVIDKSLATIKGRGLIVPFNQTNNTVPFEVKVIDGSFTFNMNTTGACRYETLPEVIIYPEEKKQIDGTNRGQLEIEFRTIDTTKPFDRAPKSNWVSNDTWSLENQNNLIKNYIMNSTNSYGIKDNVKQTPKYKIKLTSDDIQIIKKYNKVHEYDDYNFYCKNNICLSKFLTSLKNGEYLEEAGTLTNRLIFERSTIANSIFENETEDFGNEEIEIVVEQDEVDPTDDPEDEEELGDIIDEEGSIPNDDSVDESSSPDDSSGGSTSEENPGTTTKPSTSSKVYPVSRIKSSVGLGGGIYTFTATKGIKNCYLKKGNQWVSGNETINTCSVDLKPFAGSEGTFHIWFGIETKDTDRYMSCIRVDVVKKWYGYDRTISYVADSYCS